MSLRAKHLGAAGVVIDGSVRDLQEHRDLGFPVSFIVLQIEKISFSHYCCLALRSYARNDRWRSRLLSLANQRPRSTAIFDPRGYHQPQRLYNCR